MLRVRSRFMPDELLLVGSSLPPLKSMKVSGSLAWFFDLAAGISALNLVNPTWRWDSTGCQVVHGA
ncbi:hypothetical protein OIU78_029570 [Salix suchowensis]|nr:hypothetical protein OIU78_029570 [Salix suchowensis]